MMRFNVSLIRTILLRALLFFVIAQTPLPAQAPLSVKWEELTAADFVRAIQQSQGTCILPIGILEKHGPHLPLGTDLINVRYVSVEAAKQEYAVVFPEYYFGQIFEAKHEPGTIAYSAKMQMELLQETTDEMARNGCKKIVIANGHGGNENLLPYFAQTQLALPHDYVVYIMPLPEHLDQPGRPSVKDPADMHAGGDGDLACDGFAAGFSSYGASEGRIRRGSETAEPSGHAVHGDLVVCAFSKSLFGRRRSRNQRARRVRHEGMDERARDGATRSEGGQREPKAAERIFRESATSA